MGAVHDQIIEECRASLYGYALALTHDPEEAADLFQDAVVRAMSTQRPPDEPRALKSWLFTLLRNLWIDEQRARRRRKALHQSVGAQNDIPIATTSDGMVATHLAVRQAFGQLGKDHRDVLALVDIGGFSYQEVAGILGVPRGTVMSRVSRARCALADIRSDSRVVDMETARRRIGLRGAR